MTKIIDFKKKPATWQEEAIMLEAFVTNLIDEDSDLSEQLEDAVLVYSIKGGDVIFHSTSNTSVDRVGMMCSAVHIACVYNRDEEPIH